MNKLLKKAFLLMSLWLPSNLVMAQASSSMDSSTVFYITSGFIFIVALLILGVCVVVLKLLQFMVKEQAQKIAEEKGIELVQEESWWSKIWTSANDFVPVEKEETILLDHDYDGIKELDNHLPPWWKWMFYVSIVFAVIYLAAYHVFDTMPLQEQEYITEMTIAEERKMALQASLPELVLDESNLEALTDAASLSKGKQVFNINCAACHKESGAGGIGPNLTDEYWLHGGSLTDVFRTVKVGVPEKGMISWEPVLSPTQIHQVSSYVMTLRGTNPPLAKEPQGELYVISEDAEAVESDSVVMDSAVVVVDSLAISAL